MIQKTFPPFDLLVIGSGPSGQRAALQGAKAGKNVALIEEEPAVGGFCVHTGTLPSKSFRESVYRWSLSSRGRLAQEHLVDEVDFLNQPPIPDIKRLLKRRDRVVQGETQVIGDQLLRNKITLFHGRARFKSANEVEVVKPSGKKETISAQFIVIGVGGRPVTPKLFNIDGRRVFDSNSILDLKRVPRSMAVLGAGIIGCEYASMFSMAGTKVYLIDRRPEILASVDREIVKHLVERFKHDGMELVLGCDLTRLEVPKKENDELTLHLSDCGQLKTEVVLSAQGRVGNTENMGLAEIGILLDERGLIRVDSFFRTEVLNIYAVGDVIGAPALAATSMEQGRRATCHAFNISEGGMPNLYPYGIYTIPEISMIGPTEEELVARKANFVAGRARYREMARGQIVGDRWGMLKLLVDRDSLEILGVHIFGDNAADLVHIGQAVMSFGGKVTYFIESVFNYPTLAEAYKTAAFHAVNQIRGVTQTK